ncbi:hypothetical protein EK0264_14940 [Epidermidibacterium keratini]|uniref:Uncharacterized protein n=1 Tax=Epidermidibacterium keratini TaxID=1891644 RepID=A0A7L4YQM2_9ACTN|nr:hypothetical protein [Epidermidibacterium keratini]QHC01456.1 hypothetical protein EK0264_14940 [Epidermidibacterium keratini]
MSYPSPGQQPGYGQQPYPPQPGYGQQGYGPGHGQPGYGAGPNGYQPAYPGYSHEAQGGPAPRRARSNPVAAILTLIGGVAGIAVGALPWPGADMPGVIAGWNMIVGGAPYHNADEYGGGTELMMLGISIIACALGGVIALIASFGMFAKRPSHRGLGTVALIGALLMIGGAVLVLIISEGQVLSSGTYPAWMLVLCGIPTLIGALMAMARK